MRNQHGDFIWYELLTPDPGGAKAFYDGVVHWDIEPKPAGEMDYRMIRAGSEQAGGVMRLTDDMAAHGARPTWLGYVGVDDVDAAVASIARAGGKTLMPAFDIPDVGRIAMVADPQAVPFYVMRGAVDAVSTAFSPAATGHCGWNELSTPDPAAARRFYGEQFGWTSDEFMPMGEMGEYRFLDHHGVRLGAMTPVPRDERPRWRFYFRVRSIAAAKEAVIALGGTVAMGPMEVPGGDHILIGFDPQGAELALVGKHEENAQ